LVAARAPLIREAEEEISPQSQTQLTRVKSSPAGGRSSSELFSRKIESERPIAILRIDSTHRGHVTAAPANQRVPQIMSNVFVPISVSEERFNQVQYLTMTCTKVCLFVCLFVVHLWRLLYCTVADSDGGVWILGLSYVHPHFAPQSPPPPRTRRAA